MLFCLGLSGGQSLQQADRLRATAPLFLSKIRDKAGAGGSIFLGGAL